MALTNCEESFGSRSITTPKCDTRQSLCRVFLRLCRVLQALDKNGDSGNDCYPCGRLNADCRVDGLLPTKPSFACSAALLVPSVLHTPAPSPSVAAGSSTLLFSSSSPHFLSRGRSRAGEMGANCLAQTNALFRKNLMIQVMRPRLLTILISLRVSNLDSFFVGKTFFKSLPLKTLTLLQQYCI
jgi:hypothetical protein